MTDFLKLVFNKFNSSLTDEEIIVGCVKGNRKCQEMLYQKFSKKMFGICLGYTKDRDSAQDVLQESFIKVFKKISDYNSEGSLEGWIRRIVVNTAIDYHRKSSKLYVSDFENIDLEDVDNYILDQLNSEDLLMLIRKLPDGYRTIFNLFVVEGFSHEEIAQKLGISESTSRSQLVRARKILQEWVIEMNEIKHPVNSNAR